MDQGEIYSEMKSFVEDRNSDRIYRFLQLVFLSMLIVSGSVFLASGPTERSVVLQNSSSIEHIEDNKFGSVIYYNRRAFPVYHSAEEFQACVYTSGDSSPIVKQIDGRNMVIGSNGVEEIDLNISLSPEDLERKDLNGSYRVESVRKCDIRSPPVIQFVEDYSSSLS